MTDGQEPVQPADSNELSVPIERRPKHIAIIMDGNGRWAQSQGLPRIEGHLRGVESVRTVMQACRDFSIECLTLYCFSSENWKRPADELDFLMSLLKEYLIGEREELVQNNLRLRIIGRREGLPEEVLQEMDKTLEACAKNDGMTLCLAINYGARTEVVDAVRSVVRSLPAGVADEDLETLVTEETIDQHLYTRGLPDPDLMIRTSGEMRISNFLLWQISYAELHITDTAWPVFGRAELAKAIEDYASRDRRFGGIKV